MPEDFYEIEDVLQRRLCKASLMYEYKVRFKGYQSDEDMWLPASYFNRAIKFKSTSLFGRKRKHKIDPDAARVISNKRRRICIEESKKGIKKEKKKTLRASSFRKNEMQETKPVNVHEGKPGYSTLSTMQDSETDTTEIQDTAPKSSKSRPFQPMVSRSDSPKKQHETMDQQSSKVAEDDKLPRQKKKRGSRCNSKKNAYDNKTSPKERKEGPSKKKNFVRAKDKGKAFRASLAPMHDGNDGQTVFYLLCLRNRTLHCRQRLQIWPPTRMKDNQSLLQIPMSKVRKGLFKRPRRIPQES